jgi:hypothetical protein
VQLSRATKNWALLNGGMFLNVKPKVSRSKTALESAIPKIGILLLWHERYWARVGLQDIFV